MISTAIGAGIGAVHGYKSAPAKDRTKKSILYGLAGGLAGWGAGVVLKIIGRAILNEAAPQQESLPAKKG